MPPISYGHAGYPIAYYTQRRNHICSSHIRLCKHWRLNRMWLSLFQSVSQSRVILVRMRHDISVWTNIRFLFKRLRHDVRHFSTKRSSLLSGATEKLASAVPAVKSKNSCLLLPTDVPYAHAKWVRERSAREGGCSHSWEPLYNQYHHWICSKQQSCVGSWQLNISAQCEQLSRSVSVPIGIL